MFRILRLIALTGRSLLVRPVSVPIEIPGLDRIAPELPDGRFILVEGDLGPTKSYFSARIAGSSAARGRPVTVLTTRPPDDMESLLDRTGSVSARPDVLNAQIWDDFLKETREAMDLVVDSFSLLAMQTPPAGLAEALRSFASRLRKNDRIAVLTLERGMLEKRALAVACHLADGIIQFHAREEPDGILEYLRIPKWVDGRNHGRNIYYGFEGRRMNIDTRRRVN